MSDGNDRSQKRPPNSGYTMNPYYYQHYYAAAVPAGSYASAGMTAGQQAAMYPVVDPTQPGGYRWVYHPAYIAAATQPQPAQQGMAAAYYFPYHAAYANQYHQQMAVAAAHQYHQVASSHQQQHEDQTPPLQITQEKSATNTDSVPLAGDDSGCNSSSSTSLDVPVPSTVPTTTMVNGGTGSATALPPLSRSVSRVSGAGSGIPEPLLLIRKTSQGFSHETSKFRLSRTSSRASIGTSEEAEVHESVSRTRTIDDKKEDVSYTKSTMHLIDAIRYASIGGVHVPEGVSDRWSKLLEAMKVDIPLIGQDVDIPVGLMNPINSKICYLNSVVQVLRPIQPLMSLMSLSLSHLGTELVDGGKDLLWTVALARSYRLMFNPPIGSHVSLLNAVGMDVCIEKLGGIGNQQDVAEALCIVLDRLHEEWKVSRHGSPGGGPLGEDSIIYDIFRGIRRYGKDCLEMFTTIHLAPPGVVGGFPTTPTKSVCLGDLLKETFSIDSSLLHVLPPVLCIELSRHLTENQLTTSQTSVPFPGTLSIPRECCTDECIDRKYELIGVVVRSGVYANSGHFWVAQRRGRNKWFWINDTEVTECAGVDETDIEDSVRNSISKKLDASSNWCVLVYADVDCKIRFHP